MFMRHLFSLFGGLDNNMWNFESSIISNSGPEVRYIDFFFFDINLMIMRGHIIRSSILWLELCKVESAWMNLLNQLLLYLKKWFWKTSRKALISWVMTPLIKLSTINDEVNNFAQSSKNKKWSHLWVNLIKFSGQFYVYISLIIYLHTLSWLIYI